MTYARKSWKSWKSYQAKVLLYQVSADFCILPNQLLLLSIIIIIWSVYFKLSFYAFSCPQPKTFSFSAFNFTSTKISKSLKNSPNKLQKLVGCFNASHFYIYIIMKKIIIGISFTVNERISNSKGIKMEA